MGCPPLLPAVPPLLPALPSDSLLPSAAQADLLDIMGNNLQAWPNLKMISLHNFCGCY